ncbi:ExbD/TolR family protein [Rubritalea tangerina]|uniref:ExbD/TolR family protein n=1 Tax=Rubritalea tangerina TaxID=430798 RepID=A0ABW4Z6R3_9BACT
MQFYRPRKPIPAIPIVSLIDILVILLIFFIVTMQPKQKRTILDISMPVVGDMPTKQVQDIRSVLALSKDGEITLDSVRIHESMLDGYLAQLKTENRKLELEMDKQVRLEQMIMVSEALTRAGFESNLPTRVRDSKQQTDS